VSILCPKCDSSDQVSEVSRQQVRETIEDVIYVEQKIKKFNREGSENMETIRIPEFEEREVCVDLVEYQCAGCGWKQTVRENEVSLAD
jgi:hypothetical protein